MKNKLLEVAKQVSFPLIVVIIYYTAGVRVSGMCGESAVIIEPSSMSSALIGVTIALAITGFVEVVFSVDKALKGK